MTTRKLLPANRQLKIRSTRNSECAVPLSSLDWEEWWIDFGFSGTMLYLKVPRREDESVHRVYCRWTDRPSVKVVNGELYWLVTQKTAKR